MGMKANKWKERGVVCEERERERELPTTLDPPDPIVIDDLSAWIRFQILLFEERWKKMELFAKGKLRRIKQNR